MIALLATLLILGAQSPPERLPLLPLPDGPHAWTIRVETTGGFTGRGTGSVTTSSDGRVFCIVLRCPARLQPEPHQSLSHLVRAIQPIVSPRSSSPSATICNDCVTTTMTVHRRDADGDHALRYTWDVSTAPAVPADVLRLHDAILSLTALQRR